MGEIVKVDDIFCKVIKSFSVDEEEYVYLANWEDDDITGDFYIYKRDKSLGKFVKVTDSDELKRALLVVISQLS